MLQAHPANLKCISKFSLDVVDPISYQLMGDLLAKFKQIGPRITEFKAVISNNYIKLKERKDSSFKTIEKALELMTNLKSLELDGDPYWIKGENDIETRPYPLEKFEAIRGLENLILIHSINTTSIQTCGQMIFGLLPHMHKLKRFEMKFLKWNKQNIVLFQKSISM